MWSPHSRSPGGSTAASCSSTRPILVDGSIYTINNNGEALSAKTRNGKIRWRRKVASRNASSPAYSDGMLYLANLEPGQVLGLNAKNGVQRWKRRLPGRTESSPVVVGKKVIVGCECGTLYAFDKKSGKTLWEAGLPGEIKAAPAVSDGVAYVGDYSGQFSAVRIDDGSIKWQSGSQGGSFGRAGDFYSTAAVAFGRVYVASKDGRVYSFEKETGDLAWSQTAGGELYAGVVAADTPNTDPTVYVGSYAGERFYALDARTGEERWSVDAGGPVIGAASLIGETVYFANLRTTDDDRRQGRQRRGGLELPRRRLQPGHLGRKAHLSDRLQDHLLAEAGREEAEEAAGRKAGQQQP